MKKALTTISLPIFRMSLGGILCFILGIGMHALQAQVDSTVVDTSGFESFEKEQKKRPPSYEDAKRFNLLFTRGLMLGATSLDSVPINGLGSGTFQLQAGFKLHLPGNLVGFRLSPGITWTRLAYNQNDLKTFPTIEDSLGLSLERERHLITYLELPISVFVNITKDEDGDSELFLEAGGFVGYLLSGNYKRRYPDGNDLDVVFTERGLQRLDSEWEPLQYGVFGRIGYKWAAVYYRFRLTSLLDEFTNPLRRPIDSEAYRNPPFPPMELGISVFL
ncbi:MAG: outer membrane beta-barrel protein [Bacteroidota bacterium]